ncbi:hypothetical protein [Actinomadura nitritigenes]|uniref:hypothetical protein n=1 Tax=Actinomadura nitritigenes TaxID=134602 RepID=UPI003D94529F
MSDHQRARRLDQRTAERLLGGAPARPANGSAGGSADGHDALRALLSAAAGPPRPGELAGEDAAAAAFRAARARPAARRSRWAAVPRYATVKVAVVAATLAAFGGGVAVAASTGHLPGRSPAPAPSHHHAPKQPWHRGDRLPQSPSPSPSVVPRTSPPRHPKPSPSPKGTPQHARTTPPGQANTRSPKAKKTHPSNGNSGSNGNNSSSNNSGKSDGNGANTAHSGRKDQSRSRSGGNGPLPGRVPGGPAHPASR